MFFTTLPSFTTIDARQVVSAAEATDPAGARWPRSKIRDDATIIHWTLD